MTDSSINQINVIDEVPVYYDPYTDENSVLFMYKSKDVDSGPVWVPWENFKDVKPAPFDMDEIKRIQKMKKDRNFSDLRAIIVGDKSEDAIVKVKDVLKREFKYGE